MRSCEPQPLLILRGPSAPPKADFQHGGSETARAAPAPLAFFVQRSSRGRGDRPRFLAGPRNDSKVIGRLDNPASRFDSFGRDFHPHASPLTPQAHLRPMKGEEVGHPTHSTLETLRLRSGRAECPIPRDGFPIGVGNDGKVIGRVAEPPARLSFLWRNGVRGLWRRRLFLCGSRRLRRRARPAWPFGRRAACRAPW